MKTDLAYLYIRIHNISSNIPLLGGKTLIGYVVIVRVENPYRDQNIGLKSVSVSLLEQVHVQCTENTTATSTVTIGKHLVTTGPYTTFPQTQVVFDSWVNKTICTYWFINNLFRGSAYRVFQDSSKYWIFGDDLRFNHKYIVIAGITELPQLWRYRLSRLTDPQYVVIEVEAHNLKSRYTRALKIIIIPLTKVRPNTYVYNALSEDANI